MGTTQSAKMLVLVGEQFACIKLIGRANVASSIDFRTLLGELQQRDYHCFVLDLSECVLMDSTFLGVLAGFGLKMLGGDKGETKRPIELLNANARITELLESLGVLHLFRLTQGPLATPATAETISPALTDASKAEVTRTCLEAHRTLMALNPENVAKFKDVTAFLAEDLKKLKP
jgi:anti-anti-sigma regulatory factor